MIKNSMQAVTIKLIQEIVPVNPSLEDLLDRFRNMDAPVIDNYKLKIDHENTKYTGTFIFKDTRGIYYVFPKIECIELVCGRTLEYNYYMKIESCLKRDFCPWEGLEKNSLDISETYRLEVEGEYDVPGTAGEKTRKRSGIAYINFTKGELYREDGTPYFEKKQFF